MYPSLKAFIKALTYHLHHLNYLHRKQTPVLRCYFHENGRTKECCLFFSNTKPIFRR